jgi:hypothetical protein
LRLVKYERLGWTKPARLYAAAIIRIRSGYSTPREKDSRGVL